MQSITTRDLEVRFAGKTALTGLNLDVLPATSLAVIGPNGSGKSTLLNVLAGTLDATSGTATTHGCTPAYVLQSTVIDRSLPITVRDTVSLGRYPSVGLFRRFGAADRSAVDDALERLDIADLANRQLHDLSGGQRQRALVAQGLAQDSAILLLDEPIIGLDLPSQKVILEVIEHEVADGRTVVLTTHDLDDARRCNQVLLLDTCAVACGTPDDVLTEEHLRTAFGGRFIRVGDQLILDDPHHHHDHD